MLHKGVMREVNALIVKCPNRQAGCRWEGELGMVEAHENAGPRSANGRGCGYVDVECRYGCGRIFQRRLLQDHEEELCPNRPVEVQISSGLKQIKGVISDNQHLKHEVAELKEKLNAVVREKDNLKDRVAQLERNQQQHKALPARGTPREVQSLRSELQELKTTQTRQSSASTLELQSIKQELERLKQERLTATIPRKIPLKVHIDPLNVAMIENLKVKGIIESEKVESTMKSVDRKHYALRNHYADSPQTIGCNATISAPHMHAHTLELLKDVLCDGAAVLDVGSGSGYLTACMAYMTAPSGYAVGIDLVGELTSKSIKSIQNDNPELLRFNIFMVTGDGHDGYAAKAPYDVIHVGGATPAVPQALYDQLKVGGRMIVPVGPQDGNQYLEQHTKQKNGSILKKRLMGVRYGPLVNSTQA